MPKCSAHSRLVWPEKTQERAKQYGPLLRLDVSFLRGQWAIRYCLSIPFFYFLPFIHYIAVAETVENVAQDFVGCHMVEFYVLAVLQFTQPLYGFISAHTHTKKTGHTTRCQVSVQTRESFRPPGAVRPNGHYF